MNSKSCAESWHRLCIAEIPSFSPYHCDSSIYSPWLLLALVRCPVGLRWDLTWISLKSEILIFGGTDKCISLHAKAGPKWFWTPEGSDFGCLAAAVREPRNFIWCRIGTSRMTCQSYRKMDNRDDHCNLKWRLSVRSSHNSSAQVTSHEGVHVRQTAERWAASQNGTADVISCDVTSFKVNVQSRDTHGTCYFQVLECILFNKGLCQNSDTSAS